ncbi:helix-turn-helix transcriptional regulator [Vibrio splendidus]|uniref:helix-turn-helix transcriptional regulator n=1 Tax=Vibrio splendidus TaxID=29497 RepID=UPI000C830722|nr:AlpA family phage regulatory protein [Vibrio splendidus]PMP38935.1 Cro/Cl family transcriptional regulator [Vibrio splendidus]
MKTQKIQLQFMSFAAVLKLVPMSRSNIYRKIKSGEFPPGISLGGSSITFLRYEIEHYLVSLIENKDKKDTVQELIKMRGQLRDKVTYPI